MCKMLKAAQEGTYKLKFEKRKMIKRGEKMEVEKTGEECIFIPVTGIWA